MHRLELMVKATCQKCKGTGRRVIRSKVIARTVSVLPFYSSKSPCGKITSTKKIIWCECVTPAPYDPEEENG